MDFSPTGGGCRGIRCAADINGQCPGDLRAPGGCNNPCTVYKTDQYCCTGSASNNCPPTDKSRFFKDRCPDAYSYPKDDQTSTFTCPGGTNYRVHVRSAICALGLEYLISDLNASSFGSFVTNIEEFAQAFLVGLMRKHHFLKENNIIWSLNFALFYAFGLLTFNSAHLLIEL
ncbi:hypothetical protein Scep_006562 [Stephania cephalantha]|uniref:Uncharacterized protein n=1 Tax=Stephania cephalantha TaxID=152367 RepID=A0AAP0PN34_9MAGN